MREAKNWEEAFDKFNSDEHKNHVSISWKNTDVCMHLHCECGGYGHFDGYFAYTIKCPKCGQLYAVDTHIEIMKIEEADSPLLDLDEE